MSVQWDNDGGMFPKNVTASNSITTPKLVIGATDVSTALKAIAQTPITSYAAGTAYSLTATPAAVTFGTTSPAIVLTVAGVYSINCRVNLEYVGATFAANRTATLKLTRTNETPGDLTGASTALVTGIVTTTTGTFMVVELPAVIYTTANIDDAIALYGSLDVVPTAGNLNVTEVSIIARRIG